MRLVKNFIVVLVLAFCFSSCSNKAIEFNNRLVEIQKNVLKQVTSFGKKLQGENVDVSQQDVKVEADSIVSFIERQIGEAQHLPVPKDGNNLKEAILKQLQFEKDMVNKIGRVSDPNVSKEEKEGIEAEFLNSQNKANKLEAAVKAAQEVFAKQHRFKLEDN